MNYDQLISNEKVKKMAPDLILAVTEHKEQKFFLNIIEDFSI
jgi:hypothetical protein